MNETLTGISANSRWEFIGIFIDLEALRRGELACYQERREIRAATEEDAFNAGLDARVDPGKPWELANTYVFPIPR